MTVNPQSEEGRILRKLVPLTLFPSEAFAELCTNITVEQVKDDAIFKRGDTATDLIYLLSGSVTLQSGELVVDVIDAATESAKFALAHQIPRKIDAIANGLIKIVRLDAHTVNNPPMVDYQEDQGYTILEELSEDSDDWMTALLRLPLFQDLSPSNLQKILISFKTAHYNEGETVLKVDEPVDNFYLIIKGQCLLSRQLQEAEYSLKLNPGDSFGEEYLVTENPCQETVTAISECSLIQLDKKLFLSQIKTPLVRRITQAELPETRAKGAIILDVRLPRHYAKHNLTGSANIPLLSLRMRTAEIPKDKQVIVVCANGFESEAAAFLLAKQKIDAVALEGGLGIEDIDEEEQHESEFLTSVEAENETASVSDITESKPDTVLNKGDQETEKLKAENQRLHQLNRDMELKVAQLQSEKDQAENQVQLLNQHLERLKAILSRFTKS